MRAEPVGELLDRGEAFVAALLDDVGCAVELGEGLALAVTGRGDDPFGAEAVGGEDGDGAEPAGARTSEAASSEGGMSWSGCSRVRTRVPSAYGMRARSARVPIVWATNSPAASVLTSDPTSSTTPQYSWPMAWWSAGSTPR